MLLSDEINLIHIFLDFLMSGICPCAASQYLSTNGIYDNSILPCSASPASIQSWLDLANMSPKCPLHLIAWASISGATMAFTRSAVRFLQQVVLPVHFDDDDQSTGMKVFNKKNGMFGE